MNTEFMDALEMLEKEKDISKEVLIKAIKDSILAACKNQFEKSENISKIFVATLRIDASEANLVLFIALI